MTKVIVCGDEDGELHGHVADVIRELHDGPNPVAYYDRVQGLIAEQFLLEGNGPTTWATIVDTEEDGPVYVIVETFGFGKKAAGVLGGREAEVMAERLRDGVRNG